jgi:hypothetical protein
MNSNPTAAERSEGTSVAGPRRGSAETNRGRSEAPATDDKDETLVEAFEREGAGIAAKE